MAAKYAFFLNELIQAVDWIGTFAFALSGGLVGVQKRFDIFGVLLLAFVVSVFGGVMRDLLIGALPPVAITDLHYFVIAIAGGMVTFYWYPRGRSLQGKILLFDALGLALFAVVGTEKAILFGIHPVMAALLGMLTGIGGGMARDVLAGEVPFVLKGDIYALAALSAGAIVAAGHEMRVPAHYAMALGVCVCIFLRLMAIYRGWHAPVARSADDAKT
ncbi:MAG TPA: trimeric intracellular cation channel family protein [Usitatibacter sp.]|nr:trimeric intracellular cation channel family protein [Usitatibacter sp.]